MPSTGTPLRWTPFRQVFRSRPAAPPVIPPTSVRRLLRLRRPSGRSSLPGAARSGRGPGVEIVRFAEVAQIPVITASAARGVVPDSHPWSLGSLVHGGLAIPSADCVLVLGSAFNANVMYGGPPLFGSDQTIVQVDIAPERVGGNRAPDVTVIGDIGSVVA